jgi:hypothetical protein
MTDENQNSDNSTDPLADPEIAAWLENFANMLQGKSKQCLRCGAEIQELEQIGRSVYALPCGCRQYQGKVPAAWK